MPNPRDSNAPYFSEKRDVSMKDFLYKYEGAAASSGLADEEKFESVIRYVAPDLRDFWETFRGYATRDWGLFRQALLDMYPDSAFGEQRTRADLHKFVDAAARTRLANSREYWLYYRRFLHLSDTLPAPLCLSNKEKSTEFFFGIHPDDRALILLHLQSQCPGIPSTDPFDFDDLAAVAKDYYANHEHYRLARQRYSAVDDGLPTFLRGATRARQDEDPRDLERPVGRSSHFEEEDPWPGQYRDYLTKMVKYSPPDSGPARKDDLDTLVRKMHSLPVNEMEYAVHYMHCVQHYPNVAKEFTRPVMSPSPVYSVQATPAQPWVAPPPVVPPSSPSTHSPRQPWSQRDPSSVTSSDTYFSFALRPEGCAFCTRSGHMVRSCLLAKDYVDSGHALSQALRVVNAFPKSDEREPSRLTARDGERDVTNDRPWCKGARVGTQGNASTNACQQISQRTGDRSKRAKRSTID